MSQKPENDPLLEKMRDFEIPGHVIEVDQDEADELGAFEETALTEEEALESVIDKAGFP
jgi:hypothetical protein